MKRNRSNSHQQSLRNLQQDSLEILLTRTLALSIRSLPVTKVIITILLTDRITQLSLTLEGTINPRNMTLNLEEAQDQEGSPISLHQEEAVCIESITQARINTPRDLASSSLPTRINSQVV